jgi:hypothetical protein
MAALPPYVTLKKKTPSISGNTPSNYIEEKAFRRVLTERKNLHSLESTQEKTK